MAIKGYSKDRSIKALDALTGGPIPKRYFIVNLGVRQLANVKEAFLLLRKEDTLDFRVIPIRMHNGETNWVKIRSLLGPKNPIETKQLEALDLLKELMAENGGIIIKERRVTKESKGKTSNVFEFTSLELFETGDDHPGISTFSAYTKLQLGQVKPLLTTEEEEREFLLEKRDIPYSVTNSLELPDDGYEEDSTVEDDISSILADMKSGKWSLNSNNPSTLKEWSGKLSKDFLTPEGIASKAGDRLYQHYNKGSKEEDVISLWNMVDFSKLKETYGRNAVNTLKDLLDDVRYAHVS